MDVDFNTTALVEALGRELGVGMIGAAAGIMAFRKPARTACDSSPIGLTPECATYAAATNDALFWLSVVGGACLLVAIGLRAREQETD